MRRFSQVVCSISLVHLYSTKSPIQVEFTTQDGKVLNLLGKDQQSVMEVGRDAKLDIEAACDGTCACSTCHVYVDPTWYGKLPTPTDDENDMLDLAWGFQEGKSRLSCQLVLNPELNGLKVKLPDQTSNQLSST